MANPPVPPPLPSHSSASQPNILPIPTSIQPLQLDGDSTNISLKWKQWISHFKLYLVATGLENVHDSRKVALLLHVIGEDALLVFNSFNKEPQEITFKELTESFESYFTPKKNLTVERHRLLTRRQRSSESINDYATALINLSLNCELGTLRSDLVKDVFICGLINSHMKERLLQEDKLDLDRALTVCKSMELSHSQVETLQSVESSSNSTMAFKIQATMPNQSRGRSVERSNDHSRNFSRASRSRRSSSRNQGRHRTHHQSQGNNQNSLCHKCGQIHIFKCPALGKTCNKCHKLNHFAHMCKSRVFTQKVCNIDNTSQDEYFIAQINSHNNESDWYIFAEINHILVKCQLDTGAQTNIICLDQLYNLNISPSIIQPCKSKITSFSGNEIPQCGSCILECKINDVMSKIYFVVVKMKCTTILGLNTCTKLGLIKKVQSLHTIHNSLPVVSKYQSVFQGLGCVKTECTLRVNPNVKPVVDPPRKLPFKLYSKVKQELSRMEAQNVIEKVTEPSAWVNSMVVVEKKNGDLRICIDPRSLNKAISRPIFQLPTLEVIRSRLAGSKIFSTLDANSGFWLIPVDRESSKLLTFNTPIGRFRFKRLPFGINCASEEFHRIMTESFGDLPGVEIYLDDILVHGPTEEVHDCRLENVLKRAQDLNITFNLPKCHFRMSQVRYLGHLFNQNGMSPDPQKVKAITEMPIPSDQKSLHRFLGMVTYLGPYIPHLSDETEILRTLLISPKWSWTPAHEKAFSSLKSLISNAPVLSHFDPSVQNIVVQADSSGTAVGAAIFQNNKPIAYASKTLTACQQRYAQIEKELYAVVFACTRFKQYLYGQTVTVETDHSPLVTIFKKPLADVPCRLQRMLLSIQHYSLNVCYKPGRYMYIADTLSRASLTDQDNLLDDIIQVHVNLIKSNLAICPVTLSQIKNATMSDSSLLTVIKYCQIGWPVSKNKVLSEIKPYWSFKEDIHVIDGIVFKNNSVIIPKDLRKELLIKIHNNSHSGIERFKSLIRGIIFWPELSSDIKNLVEQCHICLKFRPNNQNEPLINHEIPNLPWEKVGIDFLQFDGKYYIVIEDYYSKYIEIVSTASLKASTVILHIKSILSRHGIPSIMFSDNGPPFNSKEFSNFCKEWEINHVTSSPHYPKSNGQIESAVKIVKNILRKCKESKTDPYLALLHQRNTPKGHIPSPSQLLMSRRLRCNFPILSKLLKPKLQNVSKYRSEYKTLQLKSKQHYNSLQQPLSTLSVGEEIHFKINPNSHWQPAIVVSCTNHPRSYIIRDMRGHEFRRNRKHLLTTPKSILHPFNYVTQQNEQNLSNVKSPNSKQQSPRFNHLSPRSNQIAPNAATPLSDVITENVQPTRTKSGRIVRPPKRFTFSEFDK